MGKSLPSATRLHEFARVTTQKLSNPKRARPISKDRVFPLETSTSSSEPRFWVERAEKLKLKMDNHPNQGKEVRIPLSDVVSDCARRWFQDSLKEAKTGDVGMQVLVGQMYYSGYGIPKDAQKGRAWIAKASKSRSSVWKLGDKRPGYNASDSDSDELEDKNDA